MFGQEIPSYGLMILIGYFAGLIVVMLRSGIFHLESLDIFIAYVFAGLGALVGGKAFYIIQGIPEFIQLHAETGLSFLQYAGEAGLVYYGGFIGAVLFIGLYCVIFKTPFWDILDTLLPALPLAQAFGRVGCFLAGCCYGIECTVGLVIPQEQSLQYIYPNLAPPGIPLLPVQLIESACTLGIFILLMVYGNTRRKPGKLLGIYMVCYGIVRFILEFFRGDARRGFAMDFSTSQWVSIVILAVGIFFLIFYKQKKGSRYIHKYANSSTSLH